MIVDIGLFFLGYAAGMKPTRLKFCLGIMAFAKNHSILCRCIPRNRIALSKMKQSAV